MLFYINFAPQGNSMHAEIPQEFMEVKGPLVQGGIYVISRFSVSNCPMQKNFYHAVPGRLMIEFTYHTRVDPARDPCAFPKYICLSPDTISRTSFVCGWKQEFPWWACASQHMIFPYTLATMVSNYYISIRCHWTYCSSWWANSSAASKSAEWHCHQRCCS